MIEKHLEGVTVENMNDFRLVNKTMSKMREYKYVIDADNEIVLERFELKNSEEIKTKYDGIGDWSDVSFGCNGDLILWKE